MVGSPYPTPLAGPISPSTCLPWTQFDTTQVVGSFQAFDALDLTYPLGGCWLWRCCCWQCGGRRLHVDRDGLMNRPCQVLLSHMSDISDGNFAAQNDGHSKVSRFLSTHSPRRKVIGYRTETAVSHPQSIQPPWGFHAVSIPETPEVYESTIATASTTNEGFNRKKLHCRLSTATLS